ncbi:MAG: hypothetical protein ACMUIL_08665 [bacterium]
MSAHDDSLSRGEPDGHGTLSRLFALEGRFGICEAILMGHWKGHS